MSQTTIMPGKISRLTDYCTICARFNYVKRSEMTSGQMSDFRTNETCQVKDCKKKERERLPGIGLASK
jgi:hypothetical protein